MIRRTKHLNIGASNPRLACGIAPMFLSMDWTEDQSKVDCGNCLRSKRHKRLVHYSVSDAYSYNYGHVAACESKLAYAFTKFKADVTCPECRNEIEAMWKTVTDSHERIRQKWEVSDLTARR